MWLSWGAASDGIKWQNYFFQVGRQGYRKLCLRKSHWVFWDSTETMRYLSLCALCRPAVSWLRGLGHNYFFPLERLIRTAKVITLPPTPLWFYSCVTVSSIWWLAVPAGMKAKPAPSGQAFFFFQSPALNLTLMISEVAFVRAKINNKKILGRSKSFNNVEYEKNSRL